MADMAEVLQNLAEAIGNMNVNRVPPPLPYKGVGSIEDFLTTFERYAQSLYQDEHDSYLQILPSFLEGEAKNIVLAFGSGTAVTYPIVKARLIAELTTRRTIGSNSYTDFFAAKRRPGESLVCYSIRLQAMADKLPNATQQTKAVMTKSKFLGCLAPSVSRQVNLHMANNDNAELTQIVKLATILDTDGGCGAVMTGNQEPVTVDVTNDPFMGLGAGPQANLIPQLMNMATQAPSGNVRGATPCYICRSDSHSPNDCPTAKNTRCYNCQELGHIARNCTKDRARNSNRGGDRGRQSGPNQAGNRDNRRGNRDYSNSNRNDYQSGSSREQVCAYCNTRGHIMMSCNHYKNSMVVCVWCGEKHASHTCEHKATSGNGAASGQ